MNRTSLLFQCFWATPILVKDIGILIRCGRVQEMVVEAGKDTLSGWFSQAALAYPPCDEINQLAQAACEAVAADATLGRA
jgi:hypothetical protein